MNVTEKNKLIKILKKYELTSLIVALFCILIFSMITWGVRYDTNDDMIFALSDYGYWKDTAAIQGRIAFYLAGPLAMLPHLANDLIYLSVVRILALCFFVFSVSLLIYSISKSRELASFVPIPLVFLASNSLGGHNFLVAYPFYIAFGMGLFLCTLAMILWGMQQQSLRVIGGSSLLLFLVLLLGGEFYFQYLPLILVGAFYFYWNNKDRQRCLVSYSIPSVAFLLALGVIISYRLFFPSQYSGNTSLSLDIGRILYTHFILSFGLLPGVQSFINRDDIFNNIIHIFAALLVAIIAFLFILYQRKSICETNLPDLIKYKMWWILAVLTIGFSVPNALISLTEKYQDWVTVHGTTNYIYSFFSYAIFSIFISILLVAFSRSRVLYFPIAGFVAVFIFYTQLNNLYVVDKQRHFSERWALFDAAVTRLSSDVRRQVHSIALSPSFFHGIPQPDYWQRYATKKLGFAGRITSGEDAEWYFGLYPSSRVGSVLLAGERGSVNYVFTSFRCSDSMPCFLRTSITNQAGISNMGFGGTQRLLSELKIKDAFLSSPLSPVPDRAILGLSFHEFDGLLDGEVVTQFTEGVYDLERNDGAFWRWARVPSKIYLNSLADKNADIEIGLTPASDMILSIDLNGVNRQFDLRAGIPQTITFSGELTKGRNIVLIDSAVTPVRLNDFDPRHFSFMISSFNVVLSSR